MTTAISVDTSEQPPGHPPIAPEDGGVVLKNPPSLTWRVDERAASYILELCQDPEFENGTIRVEGIDMPFYNHSAELAEGVWYWRYRVVTPEGERSGPGPVRSFTIGPEAISCPVPATGDILASMPAHPRIFVTPDTLEDFRQRRTGPAKEAWAHLEYQVRDWVDAHPPDPDLRPVPESPGDARRQVFYLENGRPFVPAGYTVEDLNAAGHKANALSFAYLVTGDARYADAAKRWALFAASFRIDLHLEDRAQHDTVVYCYEYGLKGVALAFDRVYDRLTGPDRAKILAHVEYHGEAACEWIRDRLQIHLNYQNSHGQQCMHALFTTVLAVATDSERAAGWADYLIRQYVNHIAWGSHDGGYTEGQKYGHKVQFILEALAALRTATGIDLFPEPRWRHTGEFWLYCMSLNYWWNHWGDCYSLIDPSFGSDADAYLTAFLAAIYDNRYVKWYSDTRVCNPSHLPMWYLSGSGVRPKPPVDTPQARLFPDVGQLAAYDRFYDHASPRIFFRSSRWGSHSHAHCDQNGFVIHAGGEILACDAGYYTYYGDDYHRQWSMASYAHNTILVDGQGQPKSIEAKGDIPGFFDTPGACYFLGDASNAYDGRLRRFRRAVLFLRPDVFVIQDDLSAPQPSDYAWVLNSFAPPEIDSDARTLTVAQQDWRLKIHHLGPGDLAYTRTNDRPYPMKTRAWCRFTEAFPQPWHTRVQTDESREDHRFLAFTHAYDQASGPRLRDVRRVSGGDADGVRFESDGSEEIVLFRTPESPDIVRVEGIESDASSVHVARAGDRSRRWFLYDGTRLNAAGIPLFRAGAPCSAAADLCPPGAGARVHLRHSGPVRVEVWLSQKPRKVFYAPPGNLPAARPLDFSWADRTAAFELSGSGETVLWVDPEFDPAASLDPILLRVEDGAGPRSLELETARADTGELVAFAELETCEPGVYEFSAAGAEVLVQDRWDPALSVRGRDCIRAALREGAEIFVRYAPGAAPEPRAALECSHRGQIVNLLCNGGFEQGIPDYPPRYWNVQHPRSDDTGWPGWSQERPASGKSCLKFTRPKDSIALTSRPMRLRTGGRYTLCFKARGSATHAEVVVSGQRGTSARVAIEPGDEWKVYRTELDVSPGHCTVSIRFASGGDPDQVLYVDDMEFGYTG